MKLFKYVNQAGGIFAGLFFMVMVALVRRGIVGKAYYVAGTFFLIFSAMFLATALVLMVRSVMWHIRSNKLGSMLRHYIYAYFGFYILLIIIDHITMGSISWAHNFLYSMIGAMLEIYAHGYKLEFISKSTGQESETEEA